MLFYLCYSIFFVRYNSTVAIAYDFVIEMKQYMAFAIVLGAKPRFDATKKLIMHYVAVATVICSFVLALGGDVVVKAVFSHPAYLGSAIFLSALIFLYTSIQEDGTVSKRSVMIVTLMLLSGIICGRSKYYGECVIALYFLYLYRPGILSKLNTKNAIIVSLVVILFVVVGWHKFDFYFISGTGEHTRFDPEAVESFARPVLYATGGLILIDHFPFGSGLASFASYPSSKYYSGLYYEYGIDKVYGLSEAKPDFICDAYYPLLAQFGVVGLILFISFFVYICRILKLMLRHNIVKYKYYFIIGSLIVCYVLIECIAGSIFVQSHGVVAMMLLGYICSEGLRIKNEQSAKKTELQLETKRYL